ncbi:TolC family protein, partial [Plasticicumulans sp.]|uniref:TolC family protein n=1 Tax=Plasticicumulans sp. TaxID=2307179 RepID=UPI00321F8FB0
MPPSRSTAGLGAGVLALMLAACTVTPVAVTDGERQTRVSADLAQLTRPVEPVTAPITLDEALRRAVSHNLDQRVKLMETAVAQGQLDVVRWDMLPQLSAQAGYRSRSNDAGSFSKNLTTGVENPDVITSAEDRTRRTAGLALSWNVLDFGLSYARARQAADQTLIAAERQRKVLHNIRQDVRQAWWRAWAAQRLLPEVTRLEARTGRALGESREIERQKLAEPLVALGYQKSLLDTLRELAARRQELDLARTELAALMGLPPGTAFRLAPPPANDPVLLALVKTPVEQLIERA